MQSQPTSRPPRGQQLPDQTRRPSGATGKSLPMPPPGVPIKGASNYVSQQRAHSPLPAQSQGQQNQSKQYSSIRHHQSNSTTQNHHGHTGNSLPRSRPSGSVSSRPSPTLSSTSAEDRLNRSSQKPGEMFGKAHTKMGPPQQARPAHQSQYSQQGQQPRGMTTGRAPAPTGRHPSANLVWGDDSVTSPREPDLITPKENYVPHMSAMSLRDPIEQQFDDLLDSLQVPASVREKFSVVSTDVKTSILTSSLNSNQTILSALGLPMPSTMQERPKVKKRLSTPLLRKAKSSGSLGSPGSSPQVGKTYSVEGDSFVIVASPLSSPNPNMQQNPFQGPVPQYRQSMDMSAHSRPATTSRHSTGPRPMSMSVFGPSSSSGSIPSYGRSSGKGLGISMPEQPDALIHWLRSHKGTDLHMDVARCKKLRMLLRHESTIWVGAFLEQGGYELILARLTDLLEVEWREEQHDDQMLYELLRCVKALSTSEVGKDALRTCCPKPFKALSGLLFSEKKPGDLPTRQIIIELWLFLFELYPSSTAAAQTPTRPSSVRFDTPPLPFIDIPALVRELVLPEIPDPRDEQHEFITQSHRPRVFRAWVQELSDICRDYFWIMCHASNSLWDVEQVDHNLVERPVAPGGATGGVEFEAMNYATTHFKLLNALCARTAKEDMKKAVILHGELLSSGMDRILVTMRKASTAYYPTLHLELARYVALLRSASPKNKLPHLIDKLIGPPPEAVRLKGPNGVGSAWLPMPVPTVGAGRRGAFDLQG